MEATLGKSVSMFKNSHDQLIRSLDIANAPDFETAKENYNSFWFKKGEPYLTAALRLYKSKKNSINLVKWDMPSIIAMLEEIAVYDGFDTDTLITSVKCHMSDPKSFTLKKLEDMFTDFDKNHRYKCPDTFKAKWMNSGAYATLMYDALYDTSLNATEIEARTLQLMFMQNHDVDYELLRQIYDNYKSKI